MESWCLLFVDPAVELGEDVIRNSKSSTETAFQGYALFHLPSIDSKIKLPIEKLLLKSHIQIIKDSQTIPPKDYTLQVIEVLFFKADDYSLIRIFCSSADFKSVKTMFRNCAEVNVIDASFPSVALSDNSLNLMKLLLVTSTYYYFKGSGDTLLHYGIKKENTALVKILLKYNINVNQRNNCGVTALHLAVNKNRTARQRTFFTKTLLKQGADVKAMTDELMTPLHMAVESRNVEVTRVLIQNGAEVNIASNKGTTPLHIAVGLRGKNEPMVQLLLQANADVHAMDAKGATPLLYAEPTVIRLLIDKGADINVQTNDKRTILLKAVERSWEELANYILSLSPNTNLEGNRKALFCALSRDGATYEKLVKNMLSKGFAICNDDAGNPTVFYGVIQKGFIQIVKRLLNAGAQVNQVHVFMDRKITPLQLAIRYKQEDIVRLLLDRGADVDCSRGTGRKVTGPTPLEDAVDHGTHKIVKMILEADPIDRFDVKHPGGFLGSIFWRCGDRHDLIEFLLEEGFDPNFVPKNSGVTCMGMVLRRESLLFDLLTKFGSRFSYEDLALYEVFTYDPLKRFLDCCTPNITAAGRDAIKKLYNGELDNLLFDCFKANELLARHLVKMEVMNPEFNVEDLVTKTEYAKLQLRLFKEECEAEFAKLKENFEGTDVSFSDILTSDVNRLAYFAENENIVKAMEPSSIGRFPIYSSILNGRFGLGVQLREVLDGATRALKFLFSELSPLPDEVLEMILRYLSNRDRVILPKCMPVKGPSKTD